MSLATLHRPRARVRRSRVDLADQIYRALVRHSADAAPLYWFAEILGATEAELRLAAASAAHLGICPDSLLYCLPPQPVTTGFEVCHNGGQLLLRLPARGLRAPLLISGQHVGPAPAEDRDATLGAGELAYTIRRLTLMARNWLPAVLDPTRHLFALTAEAWRHSTGDNRLGGGLHVHRADFTEPIATNGAHLLALVTNRQRGAHHLVNLYPVPKELA